MIVLSLLPTNVCYARSAFFFYECSGGDLVGVLGQCGSVIDLFGTVCCQHDRDRVDLQLAVLLRDLVVICYVNSIFASTVYQRIKQYLVTGQSMNEEDWAELTEVVNGVYSGFTGKLFSLYHMSDQDYHVSLLIKVRLQPKDIATLTTHSKESVASTRSRLYQKVFGKKGSTKDWDDFILSI